MSVDVDLSALFGPTAERTIDGAARRADTVAELVLSTGQTCGFDRPVVIGRRRDDVAGDPCADQLQRVDVDHPMLSRQHACVSPVGRRASVLDLGSTNGTVVVDPVGVSTVCAAGRIVLIEAGWRIEFAGAVWAKLAPQPQHGEQAGSDTERGV